MNSITETLQNSFREIFRDSPEEEKLLADARENHKDTDKHLNPPVDNAA